MNIIFMGTPDFAVGTLRALVKEGHNVVLAVTQPDKPVGRHQKLSPPAVKVWAEEHDIMVYQPESVRDPEVISELREINADIFVVAAFGQILTQELLDVPRYGCINVHASLLPKYRGASPIQWAILNGDKKTGVTIMQMGPGLDDGDIIMQEEVEIAPDDTGGTLFEKLSEIGGSVCCMALTAIEAGGGERHPQDESQSSYVGMIKKEMGHIDFNKSADEICRYVRGLRPWPVCYTYLGAATMKIWEASREPFLENMLGEKLIGNIFANQTRPGTVVHVDKDHLLVQTGDGFLSIKEVQMEGKKRMGISDFLNGYSIEIGETLGEL